MIPQLTDITIILDRSGSMGAISAEAIAGFNMFVDQQRELEGDARLTLVQFDDHYEVVYDHEPLFRVPELTPEEFHPRGATALLDAVGRTIQHTKERLAKAAPDEQPTQVVIVIITDGQENASHRFDRKLIVDMIQHQRSRYDWQFEFYGANQDVIAEAGKLGIQPGSAHTFRSSADGIRRAFAEISRSISSFRSSPGGKHGGWLNVDDSGKVARTSRLVPTDGPDSADPAGAS